MSPPSPQRRSQKSMLIAPSAAELSSPVRPEDCLESPLASRALFWRPWFMSASPSLGHLPFLFWLIEALRPARFAQVGFGDGVAFLGLCQAIEKLDLQAVGLCHLTEMETEDELPSRAKDQLEQFSEFAALVAREEGRQEDHLDLLDLLVINTPLATDRLENLSTVWLPRLSARSVVVLIDQVNARADSRTREWLTRARQDYDNLEFADTAGGVLVLLIGAKVAPKIRNLAMLAAETAEYLPIRQMFQRLGRALLSEVDARDNADAVNRLQAERFEAEARLAAQERELHLAWKSETEQAVLISDLEAKLASAQEGRAGAEAALEAAKTEAEAEITSRDTALAEAQTRAETLTETLGRAEAALEAAKAEAEAEITSRDTALAEAQTRAETLTETLGRAEAALEAAKAEAEAEITSRDTALAEAQTRAETLTETLGRAEAALEAAKAEAEAEITSRDTALAEAQTRAETLTKTLDRTKAALESAEAEAAARERRLGEALAKANQARADLEAETQRNIEDLSILALDHEAALEEVQTRAKTLAELLSQAETAKAEAAAEISARDTALVEAAARLETFSKALTRAEEARNKAQAEIVERLKDISALSESHERSYKDLEASQASSEQRARRSEKERDALLASTSWQVTKPLRHMKRMLGNH
jgi:hypothetical protein